MEGELANTGAGPVGTTGTGAGGGMPDAGIPCEVDSNCPLSSDCTTWTCKSGLCDLEVAMDGTPVAPGSVQGDCKKNVCQDGKSAVLPDDTDLVEDNDPCTVEMCSAGTKQKGPAPDGTACGDMGTLGCVGGLCEGCNKNESNCNKPTPCQKVECPVNTCIYEIEVGKVLDDPVQTDCKQEVCDANGAAMITGDLTETPPQVGDDCLIEVCMADGSMGSIVDNDGLKCGNPIDICYNDSVCAAGACAPQPKPVNTKAGDNNMLGDCKALYCDGLGGTMEGPDDADVKPDNVAGDCLVPTCSNGVLSDVPKNKGDSCSTPSNGKCCGSSCCTGASGNVNQYCDMNDVCCPSNVTCNGVCCAVIGSTCVDNACCESAKECQNVCCDTKHACANTGQCCPAQSRCNNNTCCPDGKMCMPNNTCAM